VTGVEVEALKGKKRSGENHDSLLQGFRLTCKQNPQSVKHKKGKLLISHRYNHLPLLPSDPGGVQQELVV